ncbi:MAG: hypothetical protein R3F59_00235 [Myxococcota bacterium]
MTEAAYAVTAPGLEAVLEEELRALGAQELRVDRGGVAMKVDRAALYRVHLHARVPVRVRVRLGDFRSKNLEMLGNGVKGLAWARYVHPRQRLTVQVLSAGARLPSGAERKVIHAVQDALRGVPAGRGGPPAKLPPAAILVRIDGDRAEVSVDASGERLHRRGWRRDTTEAPLRENLAAAVLALAEWDPSEPLVDPMCGSGTFPIEAATIARGLPPGAGRRFAFEAWPSHDPALWAQIRGEKGPPAGDGPIFGYDIDPSAVDAARANARRAQVAERVTLRVAPAEQLVLPERPGLVVCNPPYGARIGGARAAWRALGAALRRAEGWRVALVVPEPGLLAASGLSIPRIARFDNGGIPVALHVGPAVGGGSSGGRGRGRG